MSGGPIRRSRICGAEWRERDSREVLRAAALRPAIRPRARGHLIQSTPPGGPARHVATTWAGTLRQWGGHGWRAGGPEGSSPRRVLAVVPVLPLLALALTLVVAYSAVAQDRAVRIAPPPASETRVALVIGNSTYKDAPLKNPVNDATDMAAALRDLGFAVDLHTDASRADMKAALRRFSQTLREGGVGLFYYAGHGVQSRGRNFLIPVDASIKSEAELEFESVDANLVLAYLDEARTRVGIVVLDACRNNPFARSFRSATRGLAQMEAGRGTFIAFSTAPGSLAADGTGRNGLYTRYLLESLTQPDSDIDKVFRRVTAAVNRATRGEQVPWISTSLTGDFHFRPGAAREAPGAHPASVAVPSLRVGDRWVMRVIDAVSGKETKTYEERVASASGNVIELVQTTLTSQSRGEKVKRRSEVTVEVTTWSSRGGRSIEGDNMAMAFPLRVGKTWQYSFKAKNQKGEVLRHDRKAAVAGWETVRVPAGEFRALKIVHTGERFGPGGEERGEEAHTFWYAPESKRWIRRQVVTRGAKGGLKEELVVELVRADLRP